MNYLPNILDAVRRDVEAGNMGLLEAAEELCAAGWTNYIDIERTKRLIGLDE